MVPYWTDVLDDEGSHDGNLFVEWSFAQDGVGFLKKGKVDRIKREIHFDLSNNTNHVCNQVGRMDSETKDREDRLWRVLLDL